MNGCYKNNVVKPILKVVVGAWVLNVTVRQRTDYEPKYNTIVEKQVTPAELEGFY